jgi:hypothetical protein
VFSSLSFTADRPLPIGQKLDLSIDWPFQLDGDQLQLVASGVVVRTSGAVTALRIERYELRTRRAGLKVVPRLDIGRLKRSRNQVWGVPRG